MINDAAHGFVIEYRLIRIDILRSRFLYSLCHMVQSLGMHKIVMVKKDDIIPLCHMKCFIGVAGDPLIAL